MLFFKGAKSFDEALCCGHPPGDDEPVNWCCGGGVSASRLPAHLCDVMMNDILSLGMLYCIVCGNVASSSV